MPRPDGRVRPGEPIGSAISARAYNRALDAADWVFANKGQGLSSGTAGWAAPYSRVCAVSAVAVERWGVVRVSGIRTGPEGTGQETQGESTGFEVMPCLEVDTPAGDDDQIAIALQPLVANEVGWVAVAGVVQVKLNIEDDSHSYAVPVEGESAYLKTSETGYPVLWKEAGTGSNKWGLVQLARGGGDQIRIGRANSDWPTDGTQSIELLYQNDCDTEGSSEETIEAKNFSFPVGGGSRVKIAKAPNGCWYLVQAESVSCQPAIGGEDLSKAGNYDGSKKQVLGHASGCLQWIDVYECPQTP